MSKRIEVGDLVLLKPANCCDVVMQVTKELPRSNGKRIVMLSLIGRLGLMSAEVSSLIKVGTTNV